ncbi:MAG: HYR domain-containing protein, partial [Saprospiraceae bacterium]|nr:HYR domain-containing protein [Saprospiraceae bacterium]
EAGNVTTVTLTIEVEDDVDPVLSTEFDLAVCWESQEDVITYIEENIGQYLTDNCSQPALDGIDITLNDEEECIYTVTITIVDECGNATSIYPDESPISFTIIIDNDAPVINTELAVLDDCYELLTDNDPETVDAIQDAIAVTLENTTDCSPLSYEVDYVQLTSLCNYRIFVTITDFCGNQSFIDYVVRVDNGGPTILEDGTDELQFSCYQTEEDAIAAASATIEANDNCSQIPELEYSGYFEFTDEENCLGTVYVQVTDGCGNVTTVEFPNIRIDNTAPTVQEGNPDVTCFKTAAEAEAAIEAFVRTLAEDCTPAEDLEIEADYAVVEETPCESGIVYVTITDCAGNYNDIPFEYPVYIDNDNPVFDEIPDFVTDCIDDFFDLGYIIEPFEAIQPYVADFENCFDVTITLLESVVPVLCGEENAGYRVYQATDCAGNTAVYTLTLILEDTEAPQWDEGEGVTSIENGIACDNEGDDLEDLLAFVPAATDNNCFGVIPQLVSETEDIDGCLRTIVRVWSLTDYCGNQAESNFTQTINIIDNTPPTFNPGCQFMPPLVLNTSNELFEVDCPQEAIVTNLNNEPFEVGDELTLDDDWLVGGVLIEGLGGCVQDNCSEYEQIIVRVVGIEVDDNVEEYPCARLITLSFEIVDWCGNVSEENFVCQYLIIDDEAPVLLTDGSLDRQVSCDDAAALANALELAPEFSDACDQGELQVNYDETTGETDCSQEYTLTRTWSVTDCAGNTSTTFTQVITVYDDEAPTWVTEEGELDVTITCNDEEELGDAQAMAPVPQDNCQEALSIVKNAGELEPGNCPGTGTITNTWTVTDCANNTSLVFTQVITIIDDQAPTGTANMNIAMCYATVGAAEAAALAATSGSDNCSSVTKTVSTTGTCDALVVVTVTDCAGNTDTVQFHTKIDNTPPTVTAGQINACYPTLVLAENAAKNATIREDNCPGAMGISASTVGVCPATITVTVTDMCGNAASTQYVVCIGTEGSVEIVEEASDMIVGCEDAADLQAWLDNHGGAVAEPEDVQWSHTAVEFGDVDCISHSKSVTVTFTATDGCGYTDETTATFTIKDVTPPSVDPVIPQTNLNCINGTPPAADFNLLTGLGDNCDQSLTLAVAATTSNGGAGCPGNPRTYLRTYTVTDDYCNVSTATHMIVVVDNVPPTFTAPANTTVYIDENCNYNADPAVTGDVTNEMDNCSVNQATYSDFISFGDLTPPVQYMIIRTWSVTDACGNAASTQVQIITVVDPILPTISCPADISVTGGNVEGNTCAWLGSGTSPTYDDNCDPPTLTYTLNGFFVGSSTGSGTVDNRIFLEGTTTVTYTVTDPAGNTASCSFTVNVNCTTISGRIIWEHNGAGVNATTVRLTQGLTLVHSTVTNASGNYTLIPTGVGAHTITPLKNINITNGLTAADVYIVQQHLLGTLITNPYKKVAADVNRTGFITTQDANLINGAIMGDPAALAIFNVSWRFVPTTYSMPATAPNVVPSFPDNITVNVTGPDITGQDFYGIKLGDVNGSANPLALADLSPLVWSVKDEVLQAGKTYELSFDANGFDELVAYQFALQFDPSKMKYLGYESTGATAMNDSQIGLLHIEDGELRVVWTNVAPQSLGLGTPVFKLRFKALESGKRLSEVIDLNHDAVEGLAFNQALTSGEVKLVFTAATDVNNPTTFGKPQLQLFQNKPNPFVDATTIGFVLPEACDAQLRVLDVSGRQLANYNRQYTAGYHEIEFRMANAASYGVLYYELTTPFGKITKKMITGGQ